MGNDFKPLARVVGAFLAACLAGPLAAQTFPTPSSFTAAAGDGAVTLNWSGTPQPSVTAFYLYRNLLASPTATPTGTLTPVTPTPVVIVPSVATPAFVDGQVTNGRTYQYLLTEANNITQGASSAVTVTPFSLPAIVQPVQVSNIYSNALNLSWDVPLSTYPVTQYQIYRYTVPVATFTVSPSPVPASVILTASPTPYSAVGVNGFTDTAVGAAGVSYFYYLVVAEDAGTPPNFSAVPAFSSGAGSPEVLPPVAPILSAFSNSPTYGVSLVWQGPAASEAVTGYEITRNNVVVTVVPVMTPSPTVVFDDVTAPFASSAGFPLNYSVSALGPNGNTASNTASVSFYGSSVSSPITETLDTAGDAVTITWGQGSAGTYGLQGYRIYKSLNGPPPTAPTPTGTLTFVASATATPTPFATVPPPGATPTLVVVDGSVGGNANGISYWVEPFDTTGHAGTIGVPTPETLALAPTPVSTVQATGPTGNNEVVVSWSEATPGFYGPIQDYAIYREPVTQFQTVTPTPIATVAVDQSTYDDFIANAAVSTTFIYQVGAIDPKGNVSDLTATSNQVTAGPNTSRPSIPSLLPLTDDGGSLTYSWLFNPLADGVIAYQVYGPDYGTTLSGTPTPAPVATIAAGPSTLTYSFSVSAPQWQTSLDYLVAVNSQGQSLSVPATLSGINLPAYQVSANVVPGNHQIQVSWNIAPSIGPTPGVGVDSYGIYRSTTSGVSFTLIGTEPIANPFFVDSTAVGGVTYYYRMTARSDAGTTLIAESPLYPAYPNPTPVPQESVQAWPSIPLGVTAIGGVSQTTLTWLQNPASDSVTGFNVYANGVTNVAVTNVAGVTTNMVNGTVVPTPVIVAQLSQAQGTVSSYQVAALSAQGSSSLTDPVWALSAPAFTPVVELNPPPGFSPTPGATPAVPQAVWISGVTYAGPVTGYNVYSSSVTDFSTEYLVGSMTQPTSFISDPVTATQGFVTYYRVVAAGMGLSANQNVVGSTAVTLWPNPPSALNLTSGPSAVTLAWAAPSGNVTVTGFQIFRSTSAQTTPTPLAPPFPASTFTVQDSQVTPAMAYYYSLTSSNAYGTSSPVTAGILAIQPPSLGVTPGADHNQLVWSEFSPTVTPSPGAVSGYVVYRAVPTPLATPTFVEIGQVPGAAATTYSDSTVSDSVSYIYQVAAVSSDGIQSGLSSAVTQLVLPQPVENLEPFSGDQLVQLRWDYQGAPSGAVSYTLFRKLGADDIGGFQAVKTGITGNNYTDTGLLNKTFYVYQMETVDTVSGATTLSDSVTALPAKPPVVNDRTVTISQSGNANTLSWYPANLAVPFTNPPVTVFDPTSMYPLGGYVIYQSQDGGATYPVSFTAGIGQPSASSVTYADEEDIVGGKAFSYLVQAFDNPPDAPADLAHFSSYDVVTAFPLGASTALDLNAIRPGTANDVVHLRVAITKAGMVTIKVYNLAGTFIKELFHQSLGVGVYYKDPSYPDLQWDGTNMNGTLVASGVYLVTTDMPNHQEIDKVALIK